MVKLLKTGDAQFEADFQALLAAPRGAGHDVRETTSALLERVRQEGDRALIDLTQTFDRFDVSAKGLRVSTTDIDAAWDSLDTETLQALALAAERIKAFHARQTPHNLDYVDDTGTRLGQKWSPIDAVGLYVPGGLASYPSSVLMNALPAVVAGVKRLVMTVPTPDGELSPLVLAAARIAGVTEIYRIGGAQAVAALSFGTETIKPVDKIVGPGNAYVAEAKRQVFGTVGIDTIAGPSEIFVIADKSARPSWIAADLLSQAEHDRVAQSILATDNAALADAVIACVEEHLKELPRRSIARESWHNFGAVIVTHDLSGAVELANRAAPEHLELAVENPDKLMQSVRHAGAIFLGHYTPEAIGDYIAGPNHVLPTSRAARFSSGLSTYDFMKRTSFVGCTKESFAHIAGSAARLAHKEGLGAHALSLEIRQD